MIAGAIVGEGLDPPEKTVKCHCEAPQEPRRSHKENVSLRSPARGCGNPLVNPTVIKRKGIPTVA